MASMTILSSSSRTLAYSGVLTLAKVLNDEEALRHAEQCAPFQHVYVRPVDLVRILHERLTEGSKTRLHAVTLNGSAASFIVGGEDMHNDLDLIFQVDLETDSDFEYLRVLAVSCFGEAVRKNGGDPPTANHDLEQMYVKNMFKVDKDPDRWSLISFRNCQYDGAYGAGKNIDLKFVGRMRRPFEFSIDSFHIHLGSYLDFRLANKKFTHRRFPTIEVVSLWRDFEEALDHVRYRVIATTSPETIYGGGLLKYCKLLSLGYRPAFTNVRRMEQYMCSRFFIDFPTADHVKNRIHRYLQCQFGTCLSRSPAREFLAKLRQVVLESSCCLMIQDREDIITVIDSDLQKLSHPAPALPLLLPGVQPPKLCLPYFFFLQHPMLPGPLNALSPVGP